MSSAGVANSKTGPLDTTLVLSQRAVFALALLWLLLACVFPLADYDFWWHLRTGQLILERHELPRTDWFTYTNSARPWIDLHWGFQIAVACLYRWGGAALVVWTKAACLAAALAIAWRAAGDRLPAWFKSLIWFPSAVAIYGRGYERPEVVSLVLLAVWIAIALRAESRPRLVWFLPLVQLVWVNCHVLFVLGLVIGAGAVCDRVVRRGAGGRWGLAASVAQPSFKTLGIVGVLMIAASFVNPYGWEGALFPEVVYRKFTVEQDFYAARIGEFQKPFDFLRAHGLVSVTLGAELVALGGAAISFILLATRRRWSPLRLCWFLAFAHLAWEAARNTNIFCLVAGVVACANWDEWLALRSPSFADNGSTELPAWRWRRLHLGLNALVCCLWLSGSLAVVLGVWGTWTGGAKTFGWGERPGWFAHSAARFAGQPGFPPRALVAHFGQAAVYTFHNGPQRQVFLDGRLEVCAQQTLVDHELILEKIVRGDRSWEEEHRRAYGDLPLVMLDNRDCRPQIAALRQTPGWRLAYADDTATLFVEEAVAERLKWLPQPGRR